MHGPNNLSNADDKYDADRHKDVVKALIHHGAQIDLKDAKGLTPVMSARQSGAFDVVALLRWDRHQGARHVEDKA